MITVSRVPSVCFSTFERMPCSIGYDGSNTTIQCTLVAGPKLREYNKSYPSWKIVGPITKISKGNFCKGREH